MFLTDQVGFGFTMQDETNIVAERVNHELNSMCGCPGCASGGVTENDFFAMNFQANGDLIMSSAAASKPSYTYEEAGIQISRWNSKWDDEDAMNGNAFGTPGTLTYGYLTDAAATDNDTFQFNLTEIAMVEMAIRSFEEIANLDFIRVQDVGSEYINDVGSAEMVMQATNNNGGWMSGNFGNGLFTSSIVTIGELGLEDINSWAYNTALHEIGHGIGFPHPGDYNGSGATSYEDQAVYREDTKMYTVMSYWDDSYTGGNSNYWYTHPTDGSVYLGGYSTGLKLHDIAALQRLYGANMSTRTGDTVYGFNSNTGDVTWELTGYQDFIAAAIWDAGGTDTIDMSGYFFDQMIDLRQEAFSSTGGLTYNLAIAKGVVIENAIGGTGFDLIIGNSANNILDGGDDIDMVSFEDATGGITFDLTATAANGDLVMNLASVGLGVDILRNFEGAIGTAFDDSFVGNGETNIFAPGAGNDSITGGGGIDYISLEGATSGVNIGAGFLNAGTFTLAGLGTNTFSSIEGVMGTAFDDVFEGNASKQYYAGGAGNDLFIASAGGDEMRGGEGSDTIDFLAATQRVSLDLYNSTAIIVYSDGGLGFTTDDIESIENILATNNNDWVAGTSGANRLVMRGGDDTVYAQQGDDIVEGGGGNDTLYGWSGNDTIRGGSGDDLINGQQNNDQLFGGGGNDNILGESGDDFIFGNNGNDVIDAGTGNDYANGGGGVDVIRGDDGEDDLRGGGSNDTVIGGSGNDRVLGNSGNDRVFGDDGDDIVNGGGGNDSVYGGAGNDTLFGSSGRDTLIAGDGNDTLSGADGDDTLLGQNGDDQLTGGNGKDLLIGGDGNDDLNGGGFADRLYGQAGDDTLRGGGGDDLFFYGQFEGNDVILDFQDDKDTIQFARKIWGTQLSAQQVIDLYASVVGSDTVFDFGGGNTLTVIGVTDMSILVDDMLV